jgi:hypothetical protein
MPLGCMQTDVVVHYRNREENVTLKAKMTYAELESVCLEKFG